MNALGVKIAAGGLVVLVIGAGLAGTGFFQKQSVPHTAESGSSAGGQKRPARDFDGRMAAGVSESSAVATTGPGALRGTPDQGRPANAPSVARPTGSQSMPEARSAPTAALVAAQSGGPPVLPAAARGPGAPQGAGIQAFSGAAVSGDNGGSATGAAAVAPTGSGAGANRVPGNNPPGGGIIPVPAGARVPIAALDPIENRPPPQRAALERILDDFQNEVAGATGAESGPAWEQARRRADERYRILYGNDAYNQLTMQAALEALEERRSVQPAAGR